MNIFLDTEFTDFKAPRLISIGLVADNGASFYAEMETLDESVCSDFVRQVVLPKLGRFPGRVFDSLRLYTELLHWLGQFEHVEPTIFYDFDGDWTLMIGALQFNVPDWLAHQNVFNRIDDLMKEQFFLDSGLVDHHALHDAQANQFAYRGALVGRSFRRKSPENLRIS